MQLGDQEYEITRSVGPMTKYAVLVTDPLMIEYHFEKADLYRDARAARTDLIECPANIQSAYIETEDLVRYDPAEDADLNAAPIPEDVIRLVLEKLREAKRPLILAGTAIRLANVHPEFTRLIRKLNIPVVTAWNAHDVIPNSDPLYIGRPGTVGDRPGNFVLQSCDVLLVLGSRLNIRQISYNWKAFAPDAYQIAIDIDPLEL